MFDPHTLLVLHLTPTSSESLVSPVDLTLACGCSSGSPECVSVSPAGAASWEANVTSATRAPDDPLTGEERWYFASPTGGLWVSDASPTQDSGGFGGPLNAQARQEDSLGLDAGSESPVFDDTDASSAAAEAAIKCAVS